MGVTFLHFDQFSSASSSSRCLSLLTACRSGWHGTNITQGAEYPQYPSSDARPATGLPFHGLYKTQHYLPTLLKVLQRLSLQIRCDMSSLFI